MPIKQTSKITVRSGLQQNLPQLSKGEFGWAVDTQRLFIGNGTVNDGAPYVGNTEISTKASYSSMFANVGYPVSGIPDGVKDNSNLIFNLPSVPIDGTLIVWNNFPLIPNVGYTLSGSTISFTIPPTSTDNLFYYGFFTRG
jgi:hypothetical protein